MEQYKVEITKEALQDMEDMVETANRDVVTKMDYLSDSVYRYDLEIGRASCRERVSACV